MPSILFCTFKFCSCTFATSRCSSSNFFPSFLLLSDHNSWIPLSKWILYISTCVVTECLGVMTLRKGREEHFRRECLSPSLTVFLLHISHSTRCCIRILNTITKPLSLSALLYNQWNHDNTGCISLCLVSHKRPSSGRQSRQVYWGGLKEIKANNLPLPACPVALATKRVVFPLTRHTHW